MTVGFSSARMGAPARLLTLRLIDTTCIDETDHEGVWPAEGEWVANDAMRLKALTVVQRGVEPAEVQQHLMIDLGSDYEDGRSFRQNRVIFSRFIRKVDTFPLAVNVNLFLIEEDYLHDDLDEALVRQYGKVAETAHSALSDFFGSLGPQFKIASMIGKVAAVVEPLFASALADMANDCFPMNDATIGIGAFDAQLPRELQRFTIDFKETEKIKGHYRLTFSWSLHDVVVNRLDAVELAPNSVHAFSIGAAGNVFEYRRVGARDGGRTDVLATFPPFETDIPFWHHPASLTVDRGAGKGWINNFMVENNTGNIIRQFHTNGIGWQWENLGRQFPGGALPTGHLTGCAWSESIFHVFGADGSGNVLQLSYDNSWRWLNLGSSFPGEARLIPSTLAAVSDQPGSIDLFGLDRSNNLLRISWRGSRRTWVNMGRGPSGTQFHRLTGADCLAAVSWGPGNINIFGLGLPDASQKRPVIQFVEEGRTWHNLGSGFPGNLTFTGSLAAASTAPGFYEIIGPTADIKAGESVDGVGLGELTFGGGEAWVFRSKGKI